MYLSRIILNPLHPGARRDAAVPYELHRTLARVQADGEQRLLFRFEPPTPSVRTPGPIVLVQTATAPPDWSLLPEDYALAIDGPAKLSPRLTKDDILAFRLVANPTALIEKNGRTQRLGLFRAERGPDGLPTYWDWLHRKAADSGFEVIEARDSIFRLGGTDYASSIKHTIPHRGVRFDGILRVTDVERLKETLAAGIGKAKAFGFGLLTLARPR
jgi:CRISPR system Cascade subunit CasE